MWLTSSSIGRKFVMALTGAFLILFVTFHVLMNGVALFWPTAYNVICEFLGANWYALIGTAILAGGFVLHILFALWLTYENRRARGGDSYAVTSRPKQVEWSSKNMLVLGIVVLGIVVFHLNHFWAEMQLKEFQGHHAENPYELLNATFQNGWMVVAYVIWFAALGLHLMHGFWSAFQTIGMSNKVWESRLLLIGKVIVGIIVLGFSAVAVNAFIQANGCCCC